MVDTTEFIFSQHTTLSIDDGTGTTDILISGVSGITGIGSGNAAEIPLTTLASDAIETAPGLPDFGNIVINFSRRAPDDVGQAELLEVYNSQATRKFTILLSSGTLKKWTFSGWIVTIPADLGTNAVLTGSCTVRVTGRLVMAAAS